MIRLFEAFAGIGGFGLAFLRVFPEGKIVGFSEIDTFAISVYKKQFGEIRNYGDIAEIIPNELPDFDIFTFGFPCQDLSIAGKGGGLNGSRSGLFYQAVRIIDAKRPPYIIFENVKGLFSSHKGKDFYSVLQTIADAGYNGQWQLINTKWFLPQHRERIYFVGHLGRECRPEIFPLGWNEEGTGEAGFRSSKNIAGCLGTKNNSPDWRLDASSTLVIADSALNRKMEVRVDGMIPPLRANHGSGGNTLVQIGGLKGNAAEAHRIYDANGIAKTIKNGGGLGAKTGLYQINPSTESGGKQPYQQNRVYGSEGIVPALQGQMGVGSHAVKITSHHPRSGDPRKGGTGRLESEEVAFTLDRFPHIVNNVRRLTPLECERLQGFPDNWTKYGHDGKLISDTQRYKMTGNAISEPIAEEIFIRLSNHLSKNKKGA